MHNVAPDLWYGKQLDVAEKRKQRAKAIEFIHFYLILSRNMELASSKACIASQQGRENRQ